MREKKKKLKFKKIKIAKMNILYGGGETDTIVELSDDCPSDNPDCPPYPGSDIHNPCSDTCFYDTNRGCPGSNTNTVQFCVRPVTH